MKGGFTYLYVEDDPLSREVMETLLTRVVGVGDLVVFSDSNDFVEKLAALEPQPDFVFLDIHIEPYDGYELLTLIRQNPALSCKVIAVTASVMSEEVKRLKAEGFDGAIAKPLDMGTFPDLIQRLEAGESIWQIA
jgi:two-component system sensor histidine kinase BarA